MFARLLAKIFPDPPMFLGVCALGFLCLVMWQLRVIDNLEAENATLAQHLEVARNTIDADRAAYSAQIRIIREANDRVQSQRTTLGKYSGLSDDDWVRAVVDGLWLKNSSTCDSEPAAAGTVRAVPGTASAGTAETSEDDPRILRGND